MPFTGEIPGFRYDEAADRYFGLTPQELEERRLQVRARMCRMWFIDSSGGAEAGRRRTGSRREGRGCEQGPLRWAKPRRARERARVRGPRIVRSRPVRRDPEMDVRSRSQLDESFFLACSLPGSHNRQSQQPSGQQGGPLSHSGRRASGAAAGPARGAAFNDDGADSGSDGGGAGGWRPPQRPPAVASSFSLLAARELGGLSAARLRLTRRPWPPAFEGDVAVNFARRASVDGPLLVLSPTPTGVGVPRPPSLVPSLRAVVAPAPQAHSSTQSLRAAACATSHLATTALMRSSRVSHCPPPSQTDHRDGADCDLTYYGCKSAPAASAGGYHTVIAPSLGGGDGAGRRAFHFKMSGCSVR